jgi:CheY-like chemotaxis protein
VERQIHHMARLVDDLLDVSRINRGTIDLRRQTVDIAQIVRQAVQNCRPLMEAQEHRLEVSVPEEAIWVNADATRLEQVLANLLSNAAKYTPAQGEVTINCEALDGQARISIRDNGRGIPAAMLAQVFDLFTQVSPSLDRSLGGLGLGLTLVRRLVEMHGGSVSAHSEGEGLGAEFVVLLPTTNDPPTAEDRRPTVCGDHIRACRRVLIVEDNPDSRETLCDLIQIWGHEVATASDGKTGFDVLAEFRPDVALIDIGLPGIDGYELARQFRATDSGGGVTLVALTGYGQPEDRRRALKAGFDDHLVKPLDPEKLRRLLAEL